MINKNNIRTALLAVGITLSLSACSAFDWLVYKYDIPQGNYMEKQQVEKLRIQMTKEQVEFVLGKPVLRDSFKSDAWYYVYQFKSGRNGQLTRKELVVHFDKQGKLLKVDSDYALSEDFNTPLEESK